MKLYDCKIAPNPRRVRIFLAEKGLDIPKIEINIVNGDNLKPKYLRVNPRGLVPVLELDDGFRIDETVAICRYLEEVYPHPQLMGATPLEKATIEAWQRHVEFDGLAAMSDVLRQMAPSFQQSASSAAAAERAPASVRRFFERLEQRLAESEFLAGPTFSIADITALCMVDTIGSASVLIPEGHAHSRRWYTAVSTRPSAKA
jgi:glutathione S-transferase